MATKDPGIARVACKHMALGLVGRGFRPWDLRPEPLVFPVWESL
jgi:hypothetical protein